MSRALTAELRNLLRLFGRDIPRSKPAAARHLAEIEAKQKQVAALMPAKHSRRLARGWWRF